jgi:hypothetical protein
VTGKLRRGDAEKNAERKKKRIKSKHEDAEEAENRVKKRGDRRVGEFRNVATTVAAQSDRILTV